MTRTSGRSAILTTTLANHLAQLSFAFEHFGWKWTFADARRVSAYDTQHARQTIRRQTGTDDGAARNRG